MDNNGWAGPTRIIVADHHPCFARGFELLLTADAPEFAVVDTPVTFEDTLASLARHQPHIITLDPEISPTTSAIPEVREGFPHVRLVVLTASITTATASDAIRLGVHGFLSKELPVQAIIEALRIVRLGQVVIPPSLVNVFDDSQQAGRDLTAHEVRLLKLVSAGMDIAQVAQEIPASRSTVKRQLQAIQRKLNVHNRFQAAIHAARKDRKSVV